MSQLVIVESAAKAKTIEKYLNAIPELQGKDGGGPFKVVASLGHIQDLPAKELGVDTDAWQVRYQLLPKKTDLVAKLKKLSKEATKVYLASDMDYEGEAIAHHLHMVLGLARKQYARVTFHEITKSALKHAFLHPRDIHMPMVDAQETRRVLDRVVGYELSPLLWRRFATSRLSAGRVQSAALRMLVDRAREVGSHELLPFWTCEGIFHSSNVDTPLPAKVHVDARLATWNTEKDARMLLLSLRTHLQDWRASFTKRSVKKNPPAPFITSTLQQDAYQRFSIPAKSTMKLAQALYEAGHITYMRTDSPNLSKEAQYDLLGWIGEHYGGVFQAPREFASKSAHAQEAHECIRPTHANVRAKDLDGDWTSAHRKIYDLIWRRAVASQMVHATFAEVAYEVRHPTCPHVFHGKTNILTHEGFMKVAQPEQKADPRALQIWETYLASGSASVFLGSAKVEGDVTRPPSLFHEPSLVKALEKVGIGRPSTYATIMDKLFDKGYVTQGMNPQKQIGVRHFVLQSHGIEEHEETLCIGGKETDRLVPTSLGERVSEYLQGIVPELLDVAFTADMETNLDHISAGTASKKDVLTRFYQRFHHAVVQAEEQQAASRKKEPATSKPRNVLKEFAGEEAAVVQTRFGPALFHYPSSTFSTMMPYLAWRDKTYEELTAKEVRFLRSFPRKIPGTSREICMGRYGMYVKAGSENLPLPQNLWDNVVEGTLMAATVDTITKPEKKAWTKKRS
jgi:DNA topoisomerase I